MKHLGRGLVGGIVLALGLAVGASQAEAQARNATSLVVTSAGAKTHAQEKGSDEAEKKADKDPMGWVGIGVKIGAAGMSAANTSVSVGGQNVKSHIDKRSGVLVSVPINLGGGGAGFVLEPMLQTSSVSQDQKDPTTGLLTGASQSVSLLGFGGYLGPTFNFHVTNPLYLGFGFGIKAMYLSNNAFQYAYDAYARVPLTGTYYLSPKVAVVGELGLGYGASAFANKPHMMLDTTTGMLKNVTDDPQFGTSFAWDSSVGVRFP